MHEEGRRGDKVYVSCITIATQLNGITIRITYYLLIIKDSLSNGHEAGQPQIVELARTTMPNATTRVEHSAQQKGSTHRGLRNKVEYTWFNVRRGHPLDSDEHMDTRQGSVSPSDLLGFWL